MLMFRSLECELSAAFNYKAYWISFGHVHLTRMEVKNPIIIYMPLHKAPFYRTSPKILDYHNMIV